MSGKMIFRVTLIGDGAVGKTAIRERYLGRGFKAEHLMTIGADFAAKDMVISHNGRDYNVVFQIWDIAGQKRFQEIRSRFYLGSNAGICVFDITSQDSFQNIPKWLDELWKNNGARPPYIPIIILGNKSDLRDRHSVPIKKAEEYCEALSAKTEKLGYKVHYMETSALNGENIEEAFQKIGKLVLKFQLRS